MRQDLNIYAVGDFGPRDRWNPDFLITSLDAWPLLGVLARDPASVGALAAACRLPAASVDAMISSLADLGMVVRSGDRVSLGFAWFSRADQELVQAAVIRTAQELTDRILDRRHEIDRHLAGLRAARWTSLRDLRFAVVGCFGLDWGGLEALKASGHLEHDKVQPGDRRYVMYVEEPVERYQQRDYAGSHSMSVNEAYRWTSFGDHSGRRLGLPDLVWGLRGAVVRAQHLPEDRRELLGDFVLDAVYPQMDAAAEALIQSAEGSPFSHPLLEATNAISAGAPVVPVFFWKEEGGPMSLVVDIVKAELVATVSDRFDSLRAELGELTPLRHGVPFVECFNPIWHAVFGHTNRLLAEAGFLADPEPRVPGEGRYRWWLTVY